MEKKLAKAFNEQINHEFYSAYLYLAMSAWAETQDLPGMAHWLQAQAKEETEHGMKLFAYLNDCGQAVALKAIGEPPAEFGSALELFEQVRAHEAKVTSLIHKLYALARETADPAAEVFLQWFVSEQVEEEKNAADIVAMLKRVKPDSAALLMIDRQLAKRGEDD
ncbi:MAG: ferritin [Candidatus Omnitrophica bacterium]|nr:ferritin [Candidatus Omnitrophota bacterium]